MHPHLFTRVDKDATLVKFAIPDLDEQAIHTVKEQLTGLALKQAFILRIFVLGREFERGRTVYGQPARTDLRTGGGGRGRSQEDSSHGLDR